MKKAILLLILLILPFRAATAQEEGKPLPQLAFPLKCTLGTDCWAVSYVDTDPDPENHKDFRCGSKTTKDHQGTDFALRSRVEMEKGVDVLAALDGKVLRLRDGDDDEMKSEEEYAAIHEKNHDCGNGIIIDHGDGLLTYYCHLKNNSIVVEPREEVRKGDRIAQVGQSGYAEFPHLHFTVIGEGNHIDPFTGELKTAGCGKFKDNMWEPDIEYTPYSVFDGGFTGGVPDFAAIEKGLPKIETLKASDLNALVYWAAFYHAQKGDKLKIEIKDPDGKTFAQKETVLEVSRKRASYQYIGRKLKEPLKPGIYTGALTYEKRGYTPQTFTHKVLVE